MPKDHERNTSPLQEARENKAAFMEYAGQAGKTGRDT